jgi:DUF4097 and DUF4098 domain-containing protein YvlB
MTTNHRRIVVRLSLAAVLLLTEAGQSEAQSGRDDTRPQTSASDRSSVHRQRRTLALGAAGNLELRTVSGDITVVAGGGRDVELEVVRNVRARTPEDVQRGLAEVTAVVDHQGDRASVTAVYPSGRRLPVRVDVSYVVTAPPGTRISLSSVSGHVNVTGIKGDLSASVTSGSIEINRAGQVSTARTISGDVTLVDVASDAGMTLGTVSGNIRIERVTARRVEIDSTSGSITARRVVCERAALRTLSGEIEYSGDLARGGRYEFQSHSGNVHVVVGGQAGFTLQASSFSGTIRPEAAVTLKGVTADRRSLRGTYGDGSAVLVATTFSGNVTIGR